MLDRLSIVVVVSSPGQSPTIRILGRRALTARPDRVISQLTRLLMQSEAD